MKNFLLIILTLFFINCSTKNYDYKISISSDENKIMSNYINNHNKYILENIFISKKYIFSNNKDLLIKLKMRLNAINSHRFSGHPYVYVPMIINYQNKYYYVFSGMYDDFFKGNIDWLDDNIIYNKLMPNYVSLININISDELNNLTKDEFIKEYFLEDGKGIYKSKIVSERKLFEEINKKDEELLEILMFLSIVKYDFLVSLKNGRVFIEEI
jgi:hypothetical protein